MKGKSTILTSVNAILLPNEVNKVIEELRSNVIAFTFFDKWMVLLCI